MLFDIFVCLFASCLTVAFAYLKCSRAFCTFYNGNNNCKCYRWWPATEAGYRQKKEEEDGGMLVGREWHWGLADWLAACAEDLFIVVLCCCQTIVTTCWHSHELYVLSTPRNVVSRVKAWPGPKDNEVCRGKRGDRQRERERTAWPTALHTHALIRFLKCCQKCSGNFQSNSTSLAFLLSASATVQSKPSQEDSLRSLPPLQECIVKKQHPFWRVPQLANNNERNIDRLSIV